MTSDDRTMVELSPNFKVTRKRWWIFVVLNIASIFLGQTASLLLGRFYYAESGSSLFLVTLIQTAGFPILCIPLILIPSNPNNTSSLSDPVDKRCVTLVYLCLGVLLAGDNLLYSIGLLYLPPSTYSLINATQLAINAILTFFLNSQKFTALILNSVVVLTISSGLLSIGESSKTPSGVSRLEYTMGILCTIGAAAVYALLLSLMQLSFRKVLKAESFPVVMKMQIYTSLVATIVSFLGLFASGQWRNLGSEMENFDTGPASYIMTLVWSGISWQICSVGVFGLVFLVSALFSNVVSMSALAITPLASLVVFHDPMNGVKTLVMLLALWGFSTYLFQNYLDQRRKVVTQTQTQTHASPTSDDNSELDKASSCYVSLT